MSSLVAFSGGKDSTVTALAMAEAGEDFDLFFTPTGNELPELQAHIDRIVTLTGKRLIVPENRTLSDWIKEYAALPNFRQRWCTRLIKIVPCIAYLEANPGTTLCVGLRADEPGREGLYGEHATYRYPLREMGMGIGEVRAFLRQRGIQVPKRTDCAVCFFQRIDEWWNLWREHPEHYAEGEAWEASTGHTFRTPGRDTWPTTLRDLRAEFERGRKPLAVEREEREGRRRWVMPMFPGMEPEDDEEKCRVCSL